MYLFDRKFDHCKETQFLNVTDVICRKRHSTKKGLSNDNPSMLYCNIKFFSIEVGN